MTEKKQKTHAMDGQPICPNCDKCTWCICRGSNSCAEKAKWEVKPPKVDFQESRAYWRDMIRSN